MSRWYLLCLLLFLFVALALFISHDPHAIYPIDVWATASLQRLPHWLMYYPMLFISGFGYFFVSTLLGVVAFAVWLWREQKRQEAKCLVLTVAAGMLSSMLVKRLIQRPRPTDEFIQVLVQDRGFSFPSGHVLTYVTCYGCLFLLLRGYRNYLAGSLRALFSLLIVSVGVSRMYLGAHWLSDVTASYLLGFSILLFASSRCGVISRSLPG